MTTGSTGAHFIGPTGGTSSGGGFDGEHNDLPGRSATNTHPATSIQFDPTGLSNTDATDVQEAIEDLDAAIGTGGAVDDTPFRVNARATATGVDDGSNVNVTVHFAIGDLTVPRGDAAGYTVLIATPDTNSTPGIYTITSSGPWTPATPQPYGNHLVVTSQGEIYQGFNANDPVGGSDPGSLATSFVKLLRDLPTAGYGIEITDNLETYEVAQKVWRNNMLATMGGFDGQGTDDFLLPAVSGDPVGVRRPSSTNFDGSPLQGPRVAALKDQATSADNGWWEVFVVGDPGYYEVADFGSPQPSDGDFYFQRTEELNGHWNDDGVFSGDVAMIAPTGNHNWRIWVPEGDGMDCNFAEVYPGGTAPDPLAAYSEDVGDGSSNDITVTHNLDTKDVVVSVRDADDNEVLVDNEADTLNTVILHFDGDPPEVDEYRVTIIADGNDTGGGGGSDTTTPRLLAQWTINGAVTVQTGNKWAPIPFDHTLTHVMLGIGTAPTGSSLIVDINRRSSGSVTSSRATITAGSGGVQHETFSSADGDEGDSYAPDVDQVGSTVAGSDLTISLWGVPR